MLNAPGKFVTQTGQAIAGVETGAGQAVLSSGQGIQAAGFGVKQAAIGAGILGGTYTAVKYGGPVFKALGSVGGKVITSLGESLPEDITAISGGSAVLATGAVLAAGAAGYGVGTLFNMTPPGKALLNLSGNLGAKFADTGLGQKVYGVTQVSQLTKDVMAKYNIKPGETPEQYQARTGKSGGSTNPTSAQGVKSVQNNLQQQIDSQAVKSLPAFGGSFTPAENTQLQINTQAVNTAASHNDTQAALAAFGY